MPAVYPTQDFAEVTGLICYRPSLLDLSRRGAGHGHEILKGAVPGELPVERPTKFELVKTAEPPPLLALADEVID